MDSVQRVMTTIAHKEPDRVPTGEWGIDHDHVSRIIGHHTYWRNRKDSTIALWEGRRDEMVQSLKEDCAELVRALDYDIITLELVPPKGYRHPDPPKKTGEGEWKDSKGRIYRYAASNDSIMCITPPAEKDLLEDADIQKAFELDIDDSQFELIDYISEKFGDEKVLLFRGVDIYGSLMSPFGGDQTHWLILPMTSPEEIKKMYAPAFGRNKKILEGCAKRGIKIAMQGHDFGMNTGCLMDPAIIRDLYFPFMKMVNDEIYDNGMIPFFHCCGRIWDVLDDFAEAGYKGFQSIQKSCGMDTARMKAEYGDMFTLWTGVQCETLVSGTKEDVENEVREYMKICMPGGGFIFGSTNSVQFGANTDNYLRALEIIRKEGVYSKSI